MMNNRGKILGVINAAFILLFFLSGCREKMPSDLSKEGIIPKPVSITPSGDYFILKSSMVIYIQGESDKLKQTANYLAEKLKPATGFTFEVKPAVKTPLRGIYLTLKRDQAVAGDESYELNISKKLLKLSANSPEGLIRGIQTIRQILPAKIELSSRQEGPWEIATGNITDKPAYNYRGAMLDVARHFFGVNDIKRFIDMISFYKMNVLHLHLSDDQGWRIEIKSWPNLALHGGSTQVNGGSGGYFTYEQYSDVVKYAQDQYITIVPEIDMPGHTNAALASYAELNCDGKSRELYTGIDVGFSTFCTKKEVTYKFIDDVVKELASLTPGPYIHIGGDESHSTKKEDYIPFINRVQEIVAAHGKQVIGWDDISIATIRPGTIAQHWEKAINARTAISKGAKILMSPSTKAYLDMKYDSTTTLGQDWAAYIEIDSAYKWDPTTLIPGIKKEDVIGIEAALWSETITSIDEIEYMAFPRLCGIAEIGWTTLPERNWDEFKIRLGKHATRFKNMGINYFPSKLIPWSDIK
jgi:hexosaminidase